LGGVGVDGRQTDDSEQRRLSLPGIARLFAVIPVKTWIQSLGKESKTDDGRSKLFKKA